MRYHIWDDDTGNVVARFATLGEATALLRSMARQNGSQSVIDLAVIDYPPDGSDPVTVLEGGEFLAGQRANPSLVEIAGGQDRL